MNSELVLVIQLKEPGTKYRMAVEITSKDLEGMSKKRRSM